MTEKTLDERVADALGLRVTDGMIVYGDQPHDCSRVIGFFTKSIANCKKYIEPLLLVASTSLVKDFGGEKWRVYGKYDFCHGEGKTEEKAYCNAFLDLKKREKR